MGRPATDPMVVGQNDLQRRFLVRSIRAVSLPRSLAPPAGWGCDAYRPDRSAACLSAPGAELPSSRYVSGQTNFGTYPPLGYGIAALAMLPARDPLQALYLGRLAEAAVALGLLVAAIFLSWDPRAPTISLAGISVAMTPMVLFVATQLSPSSLEVTSAIALTAALLRLSRSLPGAEPAGIAAAETRAAWALAAIAAGLLAVSRPLGPAWIALAFLLWLAWAGPARARAAFAAGALAARAAVATVCLGSLLTLGWLALAHAGPGLDAGRMAAGLPAALASIPETLGEAIGVFGTLDTVMPKPAYLAWGLALVGAFALPVFASDDRGRRQMDLVLVAAGLATVAVALAVSLPTGFAPQGRHVLPALALLPLYGAAALAESTRPERGRLVALASRATLLGAPLVQLLAIWTSAHRQAAGASGPWAFWAAPAWSPPLGWLPWMVLAVVTALSQAGGIRESPAPGRGAGWDPPGG